MMASLTNTDEQDLFRRLQDSPDDDAAASLHFDIGLLLWNKQDDEDAKEKAAQHFILSAKLNPTNGQSFRYLGHYYRTVTLDTHRAIKCYQRAVTINPDDFDSGEPLCDLFDQQGNDTLEVAVCLQAS